MGGVVSVKPRLRFMPGERTPSTLCTGGWVDPRAGLDTEDRGKFLWPCLGSISDRPVRSQTLPRLPVWGLNSPNSISQTWPCVRCISAHAQRISTTLVTDVMLLGTPRSHIVSRHNYRFNSDCYFFNGAFERKDGGIIKHLRVCKTPPVNVEPLKLLHSQIFMDEQLLICGKWNKHEHGGRL
jgi:hypothetical protein